MSNEAIAAAITALVSAILVGTGTLIVKLRKSKSDSTQAEVDQWRQLYAEMQKRIDDSYVKFSKVEADLQSRIDKIQDAHLECQIELSAARTQLHEFGERLSAVERRPA